MHISPCHIPCSIYIHKYPSNVYLLPSSLAVLPAANSEDSFLFSSLTTENLGFVTKMQETNENFISTKLALPAKEIFYQLLIN